MARILFVYCVIGGLAGVVAPKFEFTSLMEMILPGARTNDFLNSLVHPSLTTNSDFLGYEQPRPKAPFAYANAWGNNLGLLLPYFVYSAWTDRRGWWRWLFPLALALLSAVVVGNKPLLVLAVFLGALLFDVGRWPRAMVPVFLGIAALPVAYSLNRGLWAGIALTVVAGAVALLRTRRFTELWTLGVAVAIAAVIVVASPLWGTITLRLETPHSNDRRLTVAEVVDDDDVAGLAPAGLRDHAQGRRQLRVDQRRGEPELPAVRGPAARHAGLHVATRLHHGIRRDSVVHGVPAGPVRRAHPTKGGDVSSGVHHARDLGDVLLRLRLARDPAVRADARRRPDES